MRNWNLDLIQYRFKKAIKKNLRVYLPNLEITQCKPNTELAMKLERDLFKESKRKIKLRIKTTTIVPIIMTQVLYQITEKYKVDYNKKE